ncbi:MAG: tetratricopeptide repeat protein, partial [Tannerella sp.]|nr:tetratricopeptide repeat protein [Tannerella sp.]
MEAKIKKRLYIFAASVAVIVALGSCGARKNTASSRFYHSLNSRYNIYFNGKTSFDEAFKAMNEGYKENYTEQIHMFPVSGIYREEKSVDGGPFDRAIEKGNKAIKLHSIKEKPPRKAGWQNDPKQVKLQAQEEFNPFMKQCWLLIAEGQFYNGDFLTSAVTFSYIARHFATDPEFVAEALVWQARCYTEMDWFYETNNALKKLGESGIPPKLQKKYDRMYADYLIRSEQLEQAIPYLQNAVKSEKNKRQRSRMHYLLGQIYMSTGQNEQAYRTFGKVASSNPPYEIEFASRIRQTEVFTGDNYGKVLKMLKRMAKSDKNKDFLDQVYYAMGNVYMTQPDTAKAIECYAEGIEKSTLNGMDKAICQIRLGDIYFTQKEYLKAQPCFSGALAGIQTEYKDYDRVARLSETLDELVIHYEAVHLQDSLQALARMPESERLAVIDKIIEQVIEEEKRAEEEAQKEEYLASQEALGSNLPSRNNIAMPQTPAAGAAGDNSFYFYNQQVVAQGKTQFQNKWGKRTLEDNWRRRNKKMALLPTDDEQSAAQANAPGEMAEDMNLPPDSLSSISDSLASDPKSREYYLQQIPFGEEDMEASNVIVANGLFNMGMIYKDKLENVDLSVGTFEELDRRFPDNEYKLDYYYQIYLMALRYKDAALAEKYKNRMLAEFPDNDYTIAISDPDYEYNMRMMGSVQDSIYEATYERYLAGDTTAVRSNYREVSARYPLAKLMPKFMFLNALTYVQAGDPEGFKEELTRLTEKYPEADVTELANEMLKGLLRGRQLMQGNFSSMTWNLRFGLGEDGLLSAADSARTFSSEQETPHRLLLIYTTGSIDRNQLLYTIALYNFTNFRVKGFDISFEEVGSLTIFTVSGFNNLGEIIEYYRLIYGENGYASAFDGIAAFFPISDENYATLMHGKTLEEYMTFFIENYGAAAPELV